MSVRTVLGDINASELGVTSPHEHVFIDMSVFFEEPVEIGEKICSLKPVTIEELGLLKRNPFALLDNVRLTDYGIQKEELMRFKYSGGRTIVDASNIGLSRDPELLRRMAVDTGLNIIVGSGYYVDGAQSAEIHSLSKETMTKNIVRELCNGIGHSGVRAGFIGEIGVSHIMTEFEKRSLQSACEAQIQTQAPLMVHINPWSTQGIEAMEIIESYGIDNEKVVICHSDVENRRDYIYSLLDMGVYVEFDNFGKEMFTDKWNVKPGSGRFASDWDRVLLIKEIVDRGYKDQLLFATDICLKSLLHTYGGWGYDHVLTHIVPMLDEVGVSREQIDNVLIDNPAAWLDWC